MSRQRANTSKKSSGQRDKVRYNTSPRVSVNRDGWRPKRNHNTRVIRGRSVLALDSVIKERRDVDTLHKLSIRLDLCGTVSIVGDPTYDGTAISFVDAFRSFKVFAFARLLIAPGNGLKEVFGSAQTLSVTESAFVKWCFSHAVNPTVYEVRWTAAISITIV